MAGIRRQHKKYSRPRKPFESERISQENEVVEKYGLKNKKEIWKAEAAVRKYRNIAKDLITAPQEEQDSFISKLVKKGFLAAESQMDNVLDLKKDDYLGRRLQTVVYKKGLAKTMKQARQLVTHKYVAVGERVINIPSYLVDLNEEKQIKLLEAKPKKSPQPIMGEQ